MAIQSKVQLLKPAIVEQRHPQTISKEWCVYFPAIFYLHDEVTDWIWPNCSPSSLKVESDFSMLSSLFCSCKHNAEYAKED